MCCATALRLICSNTGPTRVASRPCSATATSRPRRFTHTSPANDSAAFTKDTTRARNATKRPPSKTKSDEGGACKRRHRLQRLRALPAEKSYDQILFKLRSPDAVEILSRREPL